MKKYQKILEKCSLFDGIEEKSLHRMLHCLGARVIELDEKYTLFAEGSAAKYIALVLSGRVQVVQMDYYGNRSILAEAGPGELVGDEFACAEVDSIPVSVIATEACEVMLLDCSHILYTCSNACGFHHRLIYNLMKENKIDEARAIQNSANKIITALIKVGVMQAEKEVLNQLGFDFGVCRHPFGEPTEEEKQLIANEIIPYVG